MKIFYLKISELLDRYSKEEIWLYTETERGSSVRKHIEHCAGRFLVQNVLKEIYNINTPKITVINKKPQLENSKVQFSLTHSFDYVAGAFDDYPCGVDLEFMRKVDLDAMSKRYSKNFTTLEDFYKFWTEYEASIKLGSKPEYKYASTFQNDYYLTLLSAAKSQSAPEFIDFLKIY
jgi:phosphopantetheinyl transferase